MQLTISNLLKPLPYKNHENLHKNVNESMFSFTFLCKFLCISNFAIFFHEIFSKMYHLEIGNDIHHFGKFLVIFELGRDRSGLGKSLIQN